MEARAKRYIEDGREYDKYFPKAKLTDSTVKRGAALSDTIAFIPKAVKLTMYQTEKLAELLKGDSLYTTCHNIWDFVYDHIRYHKDEDGREQIRSPARTWHDRQRGVDCDCYTTFISTILSNLKIPHVLRITKYGHNYFQHIYPIVPMKGGGYITVDCVVDRFNFEQPFTEKKDTAMDLQFLEGTESESSREYSTDGLGKKGWFKKLTHNIGHNLLHKLNRLNPATVALRTGILASMKLNLFKVAQRLKYAYMTEDQAKARGVDMNKWQQLVKVKDKMEDIFNKAGGIPSNLKKAILTGHGNKNNDVSGLGYAPDDRVYEMNVNTPLPQLLGEDIYGSEVPTDGLGNLGDPVTGASVSVATVVMGLLSKLLKNVGNIFTKKDDKGAEDFQTTAQDDSAADAAANNATASDKSLVDNAGQSPGMNEGADDTTGEEGERKPSFWQKNKKWLLPTTLLTAAGGAIYGVVKLMQADNKNAKKKDTVEGVKHKGHKLKALPLKD